MICFLITKHCRSYIQYGVYGLELACLIHSVAGPPITAIYEATHNNLHYVKVDVMFHFQSP